MMTKMRSSRMLKMEMRKVEAMRLKGVRNVVCGGLEVIGTQ